MMMGGIGKCGMMMTGWYDEMMMSIMPMRIGMKMITAVM